MQQESNRIIAYVCTQINSTIDRRSSRNPELNLGNLIGADEINYGIISINTFTASYSH